MTKEILIVFPHNFFELKSGVHKYIYDLVLYLKRNGFSVDLFALRNFESKWLESDHFDKSLIRNLYLYDLKNDGFLKWREIKSKIVTTLGFKRSFRNLVTRKMKTAFDEILLRNQYRYVLIGYVFFSNLINNIDDRIIKIISINDFATLQMVDHDNYSKEIGHLLDTEIKHINKFDKAMCISVDEMFFFSQFAKHPAYYFVPFVFNQNFHPEADYKYDILFIGFNNIYNLKGLKWFFDNVYGKLKSNIRLLFVGKMVSAFDFPKYKNITLIEHAHDLNKIYSQVRITISPLFGGSGLKTKVLESLSFGKPVVCTIKSVIGLPIKENNGCVVCDNPDEFADAINKLLYDKFYYQYCSNKAKSFFTEYFGINRIYLTLDKVFEISSFIK